MPLTTQTVSIAAGESLSSAIDCTGGSIASVCMPPDWNGGGHNAITFQVSHDNTTFYDIFNAAGGEVSAVIIPNTVVAINPDMGLRSGQWVKIQAGTRQSPVAQNEQRDFVVTLDIPAEVAPAEPATKPGQEPVRSRPRPEQRSARKRAMRKTTRRKK